MAKTPTILKEAGCIDGEELIMQLNRAVDKLEDDMKASIPITRHSVAGMKTIGYGVKKSQRGISADAVISIARAIKSLKGW